MNNQNEKALSINFFLILTEYLLIVRRQKKGSNVSVNIAKKYNIPTDILLAISSIENGEPGVTYNNTNGTYDYVMMQINTKYIQ